MTAEQKMTRLLLQASDDLQKIYDRLIKELSKVTAQHIDAVTPDEFYNMAKACTPTQRDRVQALLDEYSKTLLALVRQGVTRSVALSGAHTAQLFKAYVQFSGEEEKKWRKTAARAFIESRMKRDGGLSLSDRVWNYTQQTKAEFELAVSQVLEKGISEGMNAERLGREVRQYLNNPDMMYRRYHLKKTMADGTKRDVVEWRRRVVDEQGKVRFVKEDLAKVGTGVYRSARQNALRLVVTETNMAYNTANCERWSEQPFVLGIRIRLSGNHPVPDICDELQGDYPRTFMWRGWHPRCRCSQSPVMMDRNGAEWKKLRSLPRDEYNAYKSPNLITALPEKFKDWLKGNKKKLGKAKERGKLPFFVRDNKEAVGGLLGWKREQAANAPSGGTAETVTYPRTREQILAAAKARHEARTDRQINDILNRLDLRQYTESQRANFAEIEKELGIKRGSSMNFEAANQGKGNLGYKTGKTEYTVNCQSCVVAHELRMRGFDVTAQPNWKNGDDPDILSKETWGCWRNADMSLLVPPELLGYSRTPTGEWQNLPTDIMMGQLDKRTKEPGRYHVSFGWKGYKYGHIVTMERRADGTAHWYDPQTGKRDFWNKEYAGRIELPRVYRVDNLNFDAKHWNVVRPVGNKAAVTKRSQRASVGLKRQTNGTMGATRVNLTREIIEYRNKTASQILERQSAATLRDGKLLYTKKSLKRSIVHAKDEEEADMFKYVAENAQSLQFVRKSELGENKDKSDDIDKKNVYRKEKRGVMFYNIYETEKDGAKWTVKTEVSGNGVEIPYNIHKQR